MVQISSIFGNFLNWSLIKGLFQNFFYFSGFKIVVGVDLPIFQQSVDSELYEWLLEEQKRRKARSVQEVIRQILFEAKAKMEAEGHG